MKMKTRVLFAIAILSVLICIVAVRVMTPDWGDRKKEIVLTVLCGAGLIKPMDELKAAFEREYQATVVVHYGGAGELMGQLATDQPCDVFIPGADKYVRDAEKKGWIANGTMRDIVGHVPVIAVADKNPKQISTLEDLARPGVTVALGDPDACAIGRLAASILKRNKLTEKIRSNIKVRTPTVNQLLLYVALGQVDGAIIWEDMVTWSQSRGKLKVISISKADNIVKTISTAVTTRSDNRGLANAFNEFVDSETGHRIWSKWGFAPWDK